MIVSILLLVLVLLFFVFINIISVGKTRPTIGQEMKIQAKDYEVTYYKSGLGKKVFLVPSAGRSSSDFNEMIISLNKSGYQTLAFEHVGILNHRSQINEIFIQLNLINHPHFKNKKITLFDLANDLKLVIDKETDPKEEIYLVGTSFGQRIVRAYHSIETNRKTKSVLIALGDENKLKNKKAQKALKNSFALHLPKFWRKKQIEYAYFANQNNVPKHWISGWYPNTALIHNTAFQNTPREDWYRGGKSFYLIIQPTEDKISPIQQHEDLNEIFGDQFKYFNLQNAGHAALPEDPESIIRETLKFFN